MNKNEVVTNMSMLSINYRTVGNKSINDWVKDSGWAAFKGTVSTEDIKEFLKTMPQLINSWLGYSQDKRCDGWYLKESEQRGYFTVGHYSQKLGMTKESKYSDPIEACAVFILKEFNGFDMGSH